MQFLWMYIDELVGKGLDAKVLVELLFKFSLTFVPTALPLAILLASLMTFGNMGEYSELTALKSSGVSLQRVMQPLMILMGVIVIIAFLFSNYIVPYSNKEARSLLFDIRRKRPDINLQAGTFNYDIDGFSIKTAAKDPETNRLDKILIYDHREKRGNVSVIYADSAYIKISPDNSAMMMTLYNGYSYNEVEEKDVEQKNRTYPTRKDQFDEQTLVLSISGFDLERSGDDLFRSASWLLKMGDLSYYIDSLRVLMNDRNNSYYQEFIKDHFYSETLINLPKNVDSSSFAHTEERLFIPDSLFNSFDKSGKSMAVSLAIDAVNNTSQFIEDRLSVMQMTTKNVRSYEADWHKKLTLPFACLIFFFIGAPLGAIIRKGGLGTPSVISVLFFVIWYVISLFGEKMVEGDLIPTFVGMWASSYLLLPIGVFLTYKASTDSVMMNIETYINGIKSTFKKFSSFFKTNKK